MKQAKALIIEDESTLGRSLCRTLQDHGYAPMQVFSQKEFYCLPPTVGHFDIVLLDLKLPDGDGFQMIKDIKAKNKQAQIIVMTGYGTIEMAVQAIKKGAFHFITKPFNMCEVVNLCAKALAHLKLQIENTHLRSCVQKQYRFDHIIGQSKKLIDLLEVVKKVASSASPVLISGESGTGKELVAKSIHFNSQQSQGPFVPVHCGAIPKELLESELFGHIKGSFTGAIKDRIGRFQMAEGGTLFLDEISTMDMSTQIKLLRVLQEKEFQPVGGDKVISSRARIISASNDNLELAIKQGTFRKDLYYRLNVLPLAIPSLRERKEDIPLLIKYFIKNVNKKRINKIKGLSDSALLSLCEYEWPGNVRELENMIERLCVLTESNFIQDSELPSKYRGAQGATFRPIVDIPDSGLDFNSTVNGFEMELISKALAKTHWNRNQAAKLLKLNRTTLLEKIKRKGLNRYAPKEEDSTIDPLAF